MELIEAIKLYIELTKRTDILNVKKLSKGIYLINDREINVTTQSIGYADPEY